MKIINKFKTWIKENTRPSLNKIKWTKYKLFITFNDEKEIEIEFNKYSCWENLNTFLKFEIYDKKAIKAPDGIYYDVKNIKSIKPEILDQIILIYNCDNIDVLYRFGDWTTKEKIEKWNERMIDKYGKEYCSI